MKVEQLMHRPVHTCHADDSLARAAELMWNYDCGCVPVVDDGNQVIGMITDRDVCMAAYTKGKPLGAIRVSSAMARPVESCRPGDTIAEAEHVMQAAQVHRLPVVADGATLIGILSLNDIAREAVRESGRRSAEVTAAGLAGTLGAVGAPRQSHALAPAA